jgi:CRISPR-associated protein (TIGR03986 family)
MVLSLGRLEELAQKAAQRIAGVVGHLPEKDIRNDLMDFIVEDLHVEDDDDVDAIYKRARELVEREARVLQQRQGQRQREHRRRDRDPIKSSLISAPFCFVALNETVVPAEDAVRNEQYAYDRPLREGYSGSIDVTLAFETPVLIGAEDKNDSELAVPLRFGKKQKYVIPGASLRGMLRNAMETVCRARLVQVNKHHRYGVRDFDHPLFVEDAGGRKRLAWDRLQAGWMRKARNDDPPKMEGDSDYVIAPCEKRVIRIRALPARINNRRPTNNGDWHLTWLTTPLAQRYARAGYQVEGEGGGPIFDFSDATKRNYLKSTADVKETDPMRGDYVVEGSAHGSTEGWLVFSDRLGTISDPDRLRSEERRRSLDEQQRIKQQKRDDLLKKLDAQNLADPGKEGYYKKREYVFLDTRAKPQRLKQKAFDRFEWINSKPSKHKRVPDGSWAIMRPTLDAGRRIPIFFTGDLANQDIDFNFGLTRIFKLPHKNSVGDILARSAAHKPVPGHPDMVTALFGHVLEADEFGPNPAVQPSPIDLQRKGRIAVGFFSLSHDTPAKESEIVKGVAMGPRASFAPFYLAGPIKDWTDEGEFESGKAKLAGRKMYFPRFPDASKADEQIYRTIRARTGNQAEQQSRQRFLVSREAERELEFAGSIRLHNVTAAEIGAVLWTLTHGADPSKPCRHMLGRAKTAGAGQVRIKSLDLKLSRHDGQTLSDAEDWELPVNGGAEGWLVKDSPSMAPFLHAFEKYMRNNDTAWPAVPEILEFLGACDPAVGKDLKADYRPVTDFKNIRDAVRASGSKRDPASSTPLRLLPAKKVSEDRLENLPYRATK